MAELGDLDDGEAVLERALWATPIPDGCAVEAYVLEWTGVRITVGQETWTAPDCEPVALPETVAECVYWFDLIESSS